MYKKKEFLTLLILIDNDEDKVLLFDRNPFYTKWNDDIKNFSQINYVLHEEDILDLKLINENKDIIENFKFDQIVKKYDTEDYIVAIYFKNGGTFCWRNRKGYFSESSSFNRRRFI